MTDPYGWRVRVVPDVIADRDLLYARLGRSWLRLRETMTGPPAIELVDVEPGTIPPPELGIPLPAGVWQAIVDLAMPQGDLAGRLDERGAALDRAERRVDDMLARALAPGVSYSSTQPRRPDSVYLERPNIEPHPFVPLEMQREARPGRCWLFVGPGMICDHLREDPIHRGEA